MSPKIVTNWCPDVSRLPKHRLLDICGRSQCGDLGNMYLCKIHSETVENLAGCSMKIGSGTQLLRHPYPSWRMSVSLY